MNASQPRIDTSKRVRISPDAKVRCSVGTSSVPSAWATSCDRVGCELPLATTRRFLVLATSPGAIPRSTSRSTVCFLRAMVRFLCSAGTCGSRGRGRSRSVVLDPPLDVALGGNAQGESSGRDVLPDHRTGTGLGAISDPNGRDEDVVRAGVHLVTDLGAMLGDVVVVRGDRAGAEVDATSDRRVADVRTGGEPCCLRRWWSSSSPRTFRSCLRRPARYPAADRRTVRPRRPPR